MHSMTRLTASALLALAAAAPALAQPSIISLGSGAPAGVSNLTAGSYYVSGGGLATTQAARWTLTGSTLSAVEIGGAGGTYSSSDGAFMIGTALNTGPQIQGNTASGVSPAFSTTPTLVVAPTSPAATEFAGRRWSASSSTWQSLGGLPTDTSLAVGSSTVTMMTFGSGSSGGSTGTFLSPNAISQNGQFVVGQGYISSYSSSAGTTISASTFRWVPWLWDANTSTMKVLPTPPRTSSNTWRPRTGAAFAVSNDGLVIAGFQEHNVASSAGADPDGGRPVVWRWNSSTSRYDMTFLPNGTDASGNFYTYSATAGTMFINAAGTVIVAKAAENLTGNLYLAKWTWNGSTSSWNPPINLGSNLSTPASWLPLAVTSCNVPPTLTPTGMSDDGDTIVGIAVYSTCSSFMSGGFIWHASDGLIQDWYDYCVAQNVPGITANYGPIGDNGDPAKGLPKLGYPTNISTDGTAVVGFQGGTQRIPGAVPWLVVNAGGATCVPPQITLNPSTTVNFSRCSFGATSTSVILNASASGTAPITYQWYKGSNPLSDGTTAGGSVISGATSFQLRINGPVPSDAGSYTCTVTGCNGATATTTAATVQPDATVSTPANDTCASAISTGEGTVTWDICGAYIADGASTCLTSGSEVADVWYLYTPTITGNVRFQTCASTYDTTLQLYNTCNGAVLACNNDVGARGVAGIGAACSSNRAVIPSYPVTAGIPIYVRIGALSTPFSHPTNPTLNGSLTISLAPTPPANDLCANAINVTGNSTTAFNLNDATDDFTFGIDTGYSLCPNDTQTASNRDVWFRLVSPCGGTYTISTCGSTITNPMIHVFSDDCGFPSLIRASDNVGSGVSSCTSNQAGIGLGTCGTNGTPLVIGGSVLIRVSQSGTGSPGTAATSGAGQLIISGTDTPCGVCCAGNGACSITAQAACNGSWSAGSSCSPNPCPGACCCGSNCSITTAAACSGSNRSFVPSAACAPFNLAYPCCRGDFNKTGAPATVQDIFDFLAGYFGNDPCADSNDSGAISVQDIFDFLAAYFGGC